MGLIARILGKDKNLETIIDRGTEFIDKAFYTDEEKAENKSKLLDWSLKMYALSSGQTLARRVIAIALVGLYIILVLMSVVVHKFDVEWAQMISKTLVDTIKQPFNIIIGFYFFNALIRDYRNKK